MAIKGKSSKAIPAGEFKAKCLRLMDQVAKTRQALTVTKRGKPVVHPADRLIIATALERSAPLVTRDERIRESGACRTVW